MPAGTSSGAAPLPANINMTKAKIVKKKHDWSWEDEVSFTVLIQKARPFDQMTIGIWEMY